MHKGGWKPFWAALGAALLVLLPLVGGTILLTRQMLRQQWLMQTAEPQRGVPIDLPKADDRMTLLLCTAGEQPGFVLFYLNAPQNAAHLLAVPGQLTVPFGDGEASLAQCYAAAARRGAVRPCWKRWPCRRIPCIWPSRPPCWKRWRRGMGPCGSAFRAH